MNYAVSGMVIDRWVGDLGGFGDMKCTVVYHSADFDGMFCREIAHKFVPDAELIGWDFGDEPLAIPEGIVYVLDLPVDRPFGAQFTNVGEGLPLCVWPPKDKSMKAQEAAIDNCIRFDRMLPNVIWIDHHKSSIETHSKSIPGYRIDGVAACRLAWQWFNNFGRDIGGAEFRHTPPKQDFIDRTVSEPLAVRLAGEYDIWDKRDPRAELFQHGLRSRELSEFDWGQMLSAEKPTIREVEKMIESGSAGLLEPDGSFVPAVVHGLLENGRVLQYARTQENDSIIKSLGFDLEFEGLKFLACNHARFNSHLFTAALRPDHDACLGFKWDGKHWSVSLYHAPGKEHHDLSTIAVKYGGGGHKGACGFVTEKLPFLP